MQHLDPEALATFVAVADTGGFTAAARRMGKSQARVSLMIGRFETTLGRRLFDRTPRGVTLTEAGEVLIGYARKILLLEDEALAALQPASFESRVCVGMPDDYIDTFGRPLVEHFLRADARIQIEIRCEFSHVLENMVEAGHIDIAIVTRAPGSAIGEFLRNEPLVWCGPAEARPELDDPLPLALFPERDCRARPHIVAALDGAGRRWRASWTSSHLPSILSALDAGAAVTALPASVVHPRHRKLGEAEALPALPPLELAMVVPADARVAVRKLATFLRSRFQKIAD